MNETTV